MSLRTKATFAEYKKQHDREVTEAEANSPLAVAARELGRLQGQLIQEQNAHSLERFNRGEDDIHLDAPKVDLNEYVNLGSELVKDRLEVAWAIFTDDYMRRNCLQWTPLGKQVTFPRYLAQNYADYGKPEAYEAAFKQAVAAGILVEGKDYIDNSPKPEPEPAPVVEEKNPHRPLTREADRWDRDKARRDTAAELTPIWNEALRPLQAQGHFTTGEQRDALYNRMRQLNVPFTVANVRAAAIKMRPEAGTETEQRDIQMSRDANHLPLEDWKQRWGVRVADVRSFAPRGNAFVSKRSDEQE